MTGTLHSKLHATLLAALLSLVPSLTRADDLTLNDGGSLSGTVRTLDPDGALTLESPLAPNPLNVNASTIERVRFTPAANPNPPGKWHAVLANGDVLDGTLESITPQQVTFLSSAAGPLTIPRTQIAALRTSSGASSVIYTATPKDNGWKSDEDFEQNGESNENTLRIRGKGAIGRQIQELPDAFALSFQLTWQGEPNFRVDFAAPSATSSNNPSDQYYLQFNRGGIGIKRETTSGGARYRNVLTLARTPDQYPDRSLTIEIRVDRSQRTLQVYLNGEREATARDPEPKPPAGNGLIFRSVASDNQLLSLSEIRVFSWDPSSDRPLDADRGDASKDSLVVTDDEQFSGTLLETRTDPTGLTFLFKSDFQEKPLEIPASAVAIAFFAAAPDALPKAGDTPLRLRLQHGGSLRLSAFTFNGPTVNATHPTLGQIQLDRASIASLERVQPNANTKDP